MPRVLIARLDSVGDVLLSGPAVRAVRERSEHIVYLCGERGHAAARLLPGVDQIVVRTAEWIDPEPADVVPRRIQQFVSELEALELDQAIIVTSFHQSPLPLALLLRMAGVPVIAAISEDYPGSLLDVRCQIDDDRHEVERSLSLVAALGYHLPAGDDRALRLRALPDVSPLLPGAEEPFIVLHPGASVPARSWDPVKMRELQRVLTGRGHHVAVTGGPHESGLSRFVAEGNLDLGGRTDLAGLASVLHRAQVVVAANTGPAHLAAAVGTPVVSIFAPTVPHGRWRPWGVPHVLLGDLTVDCAGCRAEICPVPGHPCVDDLVPGHVADAVEALLPLECGRP